MKKSVYVLVLSLVFCFSASFNVLSEGTLIGSWSFDEGSGSTVYDSTSNALNATATGYTWIDGKYGKALAFSGSDKLTFGNGAIGSKLSGAGSVTIAMWAKRSVTTSINFIRIFVNTTNAGISVTSDASGLRLGARSVSSDSWQSKSFATDSFKLNEWHHIAGVFDFENKTLEAFLDGVSLGVQSVNLSSSTFTLGSPTMPDEIGGANMVVDEARVFTGKLTAAEIARLMEAGVEGGTKYFKGGDEQSSISSGSITSKLSIKNNTDQTLDYIYITAVFMKGTNTMDSYNIVSDSVESGQTKETSLDVNVPEDSGSYYIHSYVWSNMDEMVTLIDNAELK